jgi:hypothetical protein
LGEASDSVQQSATDHTTDGADQVPVRRKSASACFVWTAHPSSGQQCAAAHGGFQPDTLNEFGDRLELREGIRVHEFDKSILQTLELVCQTENQCLPG